MSSFLSAWEVKKTMQFASLQSESNLNNVLVVICVHFVFYRALFAFFKMCIRIFKTEKM